MRRWLRWACCDLRRPCVWRRTQTGGVALPPRTGCKMHLWSTASTRPCWLLRCWAGPLSSNEACPAQATVPLGRLADRMPGDPGRGRHGSQSPGCFGRAAWARLQRPAWPESPSFSATAAFRARGPRAAVLCCAHAGPGGCPPLRLVGGVRGAAIALALPAFRSLRLEE